MNASWAKFVASVYHSIASLQESEGTFRSLDDGNGNGNEDASLRVQHTFLHIYLPSLHDDDMQFILCSKQGVDKRIGNFLSSSEPGYSS